MNKGKHFLALAMALSLLLTACGSGGNTAATMHLIKTEGTVSVDDARGKEVQPMENLGLFSGYALATEAESYGWINMDDTRLAKMDAQSQVDITKEDRLLELNVRSGNLFFNVTEPLEEDEAMNIRTSTMTVGIRGTCGWVEVGDENLMCVYLLRGKVECTVLGEDGSVLASETITAGQAALMRRKNGAASITVAEFDIRKVPAFVADELDSVEGLDFPDSSEESVQPEETEQPEESTQPADTPLTDGDRTVLTGTVRTCTIEEIVELQGDSYTNGEDPNDTMWLILLDEGSQTVECNSSGDPGIYYEAAAWAIHVQTDISQYNGQHITFSIDHDTIWWPSDTSLPLGQPYTSDIHVLASGE